MMKKYPVIQAGAAERRDGIRTERVYPPWTVMALVVVGVLYIATELTELGMGLLALRGLRAMHPGGSVLSPLVGMIVTKGPWVAGVIFSTWGLLRRRGVGWVLGVVLSGWMAACVVIQAFFLGLLLYTDPTIPSGGRALWSVAVGVGRVALAKPGITILPVVILVSLFGRRVRAWAAPAGADRVRWIAFFVLLGLGWAWMSLLLPREYLPRVVSRAESSWVFTVLGGACGLGLWAAACGVLRRRTWSVTLGQAMGVGAVVVLAIALVFRFQGASRALVYGLLGLFGQTDAFMVGVLLRGYPVAGGVLAVLSYVLMVLGLWRYGSSILSVASSRPAKKAPRSSDDGPRQVMGWEIPLGMLALAVLGVHSFGIFRDSSFLLSTTMMILSLVPVSVVYLLARVAAGYRRFTRREIALRSGLAGGLVLVVLLFYLTPGFLMSFPLADLGLRFRVWRAGGVDRIQAWAVEVVQQSGAAVPVGGVEIDLKNAPAAIRGLAPETVYRAQGGYVRIIWDGGVHHSGILVGPPTFRAQSNSRQWVKPWRDGVYGYQEIR